jgi:phosphate:Na+ symporter
MDLAGFLGGLGSFLFGLYLLSRGLTELAGNTRILQKRFSTKGYADGGKRRMRYPTFLRSAALGAGLTAILQSSGALTVFSVEAVSAGWMPAETAVALCWGANLGTTATGQLLRLSLLPGGLADGMLRNGCCFAGGLAALLLHGKAQKAGEAVFGLGLTFTGICAVQAALGPMLQSAAFLAWLAQMENPFAALAFGTLLSAGMQSSSGAIGLIQAVAAQESLPWSTAVPLILGINIGTCSTAFAAALGAQSRRKASLQVAAGHLGFNVSGCILVGILALATPRAAFWQEHAGFSDIANFHTLFNGGTLVFVIAAAGFWFWRRARQEVIRAGIH